MPLLINLLPFPILIWCRVRQIVLELHNLASAANCHIPQCRIKCLLSKLTLYRHVPLASRRALALPYQAGTAPTSFLLLSMHAILKITAVWLRQHLYFPPPAQPPTSIPILTLYCHRLVDQDQTAPRSRAWGAPLCSSPRQISPSGTTFQLGQSRSFSQKPYLYLSR
jgi:hypothetical protein